MLRIARQRGDTMIEVLFAITIFSMVAVAGLTIMNQGAAAAGRSLEITLVRQEMDAQAEALRLMYDEAMAQRSVAGGSSSSAAAKWRQLLSSKGKTASLVTSWSAMANGNQCIEPASINRAFVINVKTATVESPSGVWTSQPPLYSRVLYSSTNPNAVSSVEGIWVEAARQGAAGSTPGYTDFHIRACWNTVGQTMPVTLGTIVRLYEP